MKKANIFKQKSYKNYQYKLMKECKINIKITSILKYSSIINFNNLKKINNINK